MAAPLTSAVEAEGAPSVTTVVMELLGRGPGPRRKDSERDSELADAL